MNADFETGELSYDEEVEQEERAYINHLRDEEIGYRPPRATDEHYARWFAQEQEVKKWLASQRAKAL